MSREMGDRRGLARALYNAGESLEAAGRDRPRADDVRRGTVDSPQHRRPGQRGDVALRRRPHCRRAGRSRDRREGAQRGARDGSASRSAAADGVFHLPARRHCLDARRSRRSRSSATTTRWRSARHSAKRARPPKAAARSPASRSKRAARPTQRNWRPKPRRCLPVSQHPTTKRWLAPCSRWRCSRRAVGPPADARDRTRAGAGEESAARAGADAGDDCRGTGRAATEIPAAALSSLEADPRRRREARHRPLGIRRAPGDRRDRGPPLADGRREVDRRTQEGREGARLRTLRAVGRRMRRPTSHSRTRAAAAAHQACPATGSTAESPPSPD